MSDTLLYGTLDLNDKVTYFLLKEGFKYPSPTLKQQYADSALADGQLPTEAWKWNNRILNFSLFVHGTDAATLDAALRALYLQVYQDSTVTWCAEGRSTSFYFLAYRPEAVAPDSYFRKEYRGVNECIVTWSCQAYPFGHTDRQSLTFNGVAAASLIDIPTAYGDVPAPAQITVTGEFSSGPFSPMWSDTTADLHGINGYGASDIFAVGDNGEILVWNGVAWTLLDSGVTEQLNGVCALDSTHIYAVGGNGATVFSGDGATWADQHPLNVELLSNPGLENWTGTPPSPDGWQFLGGEIAYQAGGETPHSGTHCWAAHMNEGHSYGERIILAPVAVPVKPGSSYDLSIYFCGSSGNYVGYLYAFFSNAAGTSIQQSLITSNWTSEAYQQLSGIITAPPGAATVELRLYINANANNNTHEFLSYVDDASVQEVSAPNLNAVSAFDTTHIWAVGTGGDIRFSANSSTWASQANILLAHDLYGVAAISASNVYAVGKDGCIAHYNGSAWSHVHVGTATFRAVYAFDSTHIWAVKDAGIIYFSADGTTWTKQTSGTSKNLYGVWGYNATHVYAVGDNGVILGFSGSWKVISGNQHATLYGVYALATDKVWAAGDSGGTILQGIDSVSVMPMTNLIVAERDAYASDFAPVQEAAGETQVANASRQGGHYRSLGAGETHKFYFPVGSHTGRYILSIGTSWASSTLYDQLRIKLYLETTGGVKISATDVVLPALDLDDPNTNFKETAFANIPSGLRLPDITIPSHYVSPNANTDNINQVIEIENDASAPDIWLDCCTLLPVDRCVELSDMTASCIIFDSDEGMVLSSQLGSVDTAAAYNPANTVDSPRFVVAPDGTQLVILVGNLVAGDDQLTPLLDITINYEPQYWLIPE